jgi:Ras family protein
MPAPPKQRKIAIVGSRSVGMDKIPSLYHPWRSSLPRGTQSELAWLTISQIQGKSSLTVRFVDHHFVESYYPTIENTFSRIIKHKGQDFATEIVDTAGQVIKDTAIGRPYAKF